MTLVWLKIAKFLLFKTVFVVWLKRIGIDVENFIFTPPLAFMLVLLVLLLFSITITSWASRRGKKEKERVSEAYSCGEKFDEHLIQPDYSQFFPFAFFFTILHVVALAVATVPTENIKVFTIAFIYIAVAILGMSTLLRQET